MSKKNKRGELSTAQIIGLITLGFSFVILLWFFSISDVKGQSRVEVCKNSVVMRGTSSLSTELPLKCSREYVCITTKNGECTGMVKPNKIKVKTEEEIYGVLAEQMEDCWYMFEEGKVDYVQNTGVKRNYCSICSQILFDKSLSKIKGLENGKISKDKLYQYLATHNLSTKDITYAEYILGTKDINRLKQELSSRYSDLGEPTFGTINIGKQYYIIMGITSDISTGGWIVSGVAYGVTGAVVGILCGVSGGTALIVIAGIAGGAQAYGVQEILTKVQNPRIGAISVPGKGINNKFMAPTIEEADPDVIKALNCEDIITTSS